MKDKLNDPNWGNCSDIAVSLTAPERPKDPCIADNTYPVIACLDDIYVDASGFGYDCCNDTVLIEPSNGADILRLKNVMVEYRKLELLDVEQDPTSS